MKSAGPGQDLPSFSVTSDNVEALDAAAKDQSLRKRCAALDPSPKWYSEIDQAVLPGMKRGSNVQYIRERRTAECAVSELNYVVLLTSVQGD